ncbi:MAG: glycosyltransferase family 2 protein [Clostridiales bacterium]|nr:glycosyltransferase family 2 protein [Clostridiales bacterium]
MKKVMAVILNYNSAEDTKKCIAWIKKQSYEKLQIVVVDNRSSTDWEQLKDFCGSQAIFFIRNTENRGYSAGNNIGLRYAAEEGCEYAIIINPDMEIRDADYVEKAVAIMEQDEKIAVLGTDIVNMHGQHQNPMYEVPFAYEVLWPLEIISNKIQKNKIPYIGDFSKSGYCEKVSGCCLFVRMSFVKRIDYFDENVFLYCEEPILAANVKRSGMKEYYAAELTAYHMHKESVKGDPRIRLNEFYKSRTYYLKEYSGYKGWKLRLALISRAFNNFCYMHKKYR